MASGRRDALQTSGACASIPKPSERAARLLLAIALGLGSVRFLWLGEWSLWIDEAYTLADSMHPSDSLNPLGYRLFAAFFGLLAERPNELWMRLPSAGFGWLCIPLTAWCLAPLLSKRTAAWAALIVAISPWHLYWSQNARFYTLAQCMVLIGSGFLLRGLQRDRFLLILAGLVVLPSALLAHPSAGMLVVPLLLVLLVFRGQGRWPERMRAAGAGRSFGWRVLVLASLALALLGWRWAGDVWMVWSLRQGSGNPVHLTLSTGYLLGPLLGVGVLLGTWLTLRSRDAGGTVLTVLVAGGLLGALVVSCFVRVSAQYVFVLLPFLAGIAAIPLGALGDGRLSRIRARAGVAVYGALMLVALLGEDGLYFTVRHGDRPRWREAYRYVFDHRDWNDLILGMQAPVGEYYWAPWSDDPRSWSMLVQLDSLRARVPGDWSRYERPMWLIVNFENLGDWEDADRRRLLGFLTQSCTLEASFEVPLTPRDLDIHVYRRGLLRSP